MDKNNDKLIERKEWKKIEKKLGKLGISKQDFFMIFQDLDFNDDNNLSLDEFKGFWVVEFLAGVSNISETFVQKTT